MRKALKTEAVEFRINPTEEQIRLINVTAKACQRVYNYYLAKRKAAYDTDKTKITYNECCKDLTSFRKEEAWLQEADAQALRSSIKELDNDYVRFFITHKNYPTFKKNTKGHRSYKTICNGNNIELREHSIKLPKLGEVSTVVTNDPSTHRINQGIIGGRIMSAIVEQSAPNYYCVRLLYSTAPIQIQKPLKDSPADFLPAVNSAISPAHCNTKKSYGLDSFDLLE